MSAANDHGWRIHQKPNPYTGPPDVEHPNWTADIGPTAANHVGLVGMAARLHPAHTA